MRNRMITLIILLVLLLTGNLRIGASPSIDKGLALRKDWNRYEQLSMKDRAKDEKAQLALIMDKAKERNLPYDYYKAANQMKYNAIAVNWKDRDQALEVERQAILDFGDPALTAAYLCENKSSEHLTAYIHKELDALRQSSSPEVWKHFPTQMADYLKQPYRNNLDYALMLAMEADTQALSLLEAESPSDYPVMALSRYICSSSDKDKDELKARYPGTTVALLVEKDRLMDEIVKLKRNENHASSENFRAMKERCLGLGTKLASVSKDEGVNVREDVEELRSEADNLAATDMSLSVSEDVLKLLCRNVPEASVRVLKGNRTVWKTAVKNEKRSFFKRDTLSVAIPGLEDGEYKIKVKARGMETEVLSFDRSSLSIAGRWYDKRYWIFVADYKTGRPVKSADLEFSSCVNASFKAYALDGMTAIPASVTDKLGRSGILNLRCSYRDTDGRLVSSPVLTISRQDNMLVRSGNEKERDSGLIFMSSGVYHPGDTARFKAVFFHGDMVKSAATLPAGRKLNLELKSPDGNYKKTIECVTNEFGSVAGEFVIPETCVNGRWQIFNSQFSAFSSFYVGEYVLPNCSISIEAQDRYVFKGDSIKVRGKAVSYSGHPLTSAKLEYYSTDSQGIAEIGTDGSFEIGLVVSRSSAVNVKLTDATGETVEAKTWISVATVPSHSIIVNGLAEAKAADFKVISDNTLSFKVGLASDDFKPLPVKYELWHDSDKLAEGESVSGKDIVVELPGKSCLCEIRTRIAITDDSGELLKGENRMKVLYMADDADVVDAPVEAFLKIIPGGGISYQLGAGDGDIWAVAELWSPDGRLLDSERLHLDGVRGTIGSALRVDRVYENHFPDAVTLNLYYFRNGALHTLTHLFRRPFSGSEMPLEFSRFEDTTLPGNPYLFSVKALPESECLVSVYDKATDALGGNDWLVMTLDGPGQFHLYMNSVNGTHDSERIGYMNRALTKAYGAAKPRARMSSMSLKAARAVSEEDAGMYEAVSTAAYSETESVSDVALLDNVDIRSDYCEVLAFEPFLRTDASGEASFTVNTSDKLTAYHVAVYAHDKNMRNAKTMRDMIVSVPVKLAVVQPQFLYVGDSYVINATVSNLGAEACDGVFSIELFDGEEWRGIQPLSRVQGRLTVPASGSERISLPVGVVPRTASGRLGMKLAFACRNSQDQNVSDGMFVSVPLLLPVQKTVEAHSALLKPGMDRKALRDSLLALFKNGKKADVEESCISIREMLLHSISECSHTDAKDAVSLSSAIEFNLIAASLGGGEADCSTMVKNLLTLRCDDGGFAWLSGMDSSPAVTAVVLERLARLRRLGMIPSAFTDEITSAAVHFLDRCHTSAIQPRVWRPWLSPSRYFYVRSMWAGVPFEEKTDTHLREEDRDWLTPSHSLKYDSILSKALRIRTVLNLQSSDEALALAKAWGVKLFTGRKLDKTLDNDLESLMQYAVDHISGGVFYPNAVMPWRGLQESELYAHSLICDLMRDLVLSGHKDADRAQAIAEGIRLWIMVQKETQKWEKDSAFAEAAASVFDGSDAVMDTRVLVLTVRSEQPFAAVRKSGNGMSVNVEWSLMQDGKWQPLRNGTTLAVGSTVRATYTLYSDENRSFVRLTAGRPACLNPVEPRSGYQIWGRYRNVTATATEYMWEAYPEDKILLTEDFHVTQEGVFTAPTPVLEALYAPHYRANGPASLPIRSEFVN